jgi:hypothetical protein
MIVKNCAITKSDATIIKDWKITNTEIHSGIDLEADKVYSPFYGVVLDRFYSPQDKYTIIIQYNAFICVRFCNILNLELKRGNVVTEGQFVGTCNRYVHVEYLNYNKPDGIPPMSVRVSDLSYYKVDPTDLVYGRLEFPISGITNVTIQTFASELPKLGEISYEFGDNR